MKEDLYALDRFFVRPVTAGLNDESAWPVPRLDTVLLGCLGLGLNVLGLRVWDLRCGLC